MPLRRKRVYAKSISDCGDAPWNLGPGRPNSSRQVRSRTPSIVIQNGGRASLIRGSSVTMGDVLEKAPTIKTAMTEIEALALSALIEGSVAYLVVRVARWPSRGNLHVGFAAAAAAAVTHPQLWAAALWAYSRFAYWPSILALEAIVVLAAGALIAWIAALRIDRAMLVSLVANSASFLFGLWLEG
jgi:hypothetical protein